LTAEKQKQIDDYMQSELRRYQCDFPYAEVFETGDGLPSLVSRSVGAN
jgi:hypothetical protein